ncbi:MAG: Fe-S cluster assembly protein NifU [Candidatus Zipacnadales bacterium]
MWDYNEKVWDHIRNPRNAGVMENPDAVGEAGSLACGDALRLMLKIGDGERIIDAKYQTFGCGSAIASGSALTELLIGKTLEEASHITNQDIVEYLGGLPEEKMHCSVMGAEALQAALANYRGEPLPDTDQAEVVCKCFGITEDQIRQAVRTNQLLTVEDVTHYTKAGGGCGQCHDRILEIIEDERKAERITPLPQPKPKRLSNIQLMKGVEEALAKHVAPALRQDGGDIELVDIEGPRVYVALRGHCASCVASGATIKQFVQAKLRELVDEDIVVEEVAS